ncbi:dihydrofolate reductase family protein [Amphibacillus sediminis]|uniref:dihydrofolate reductase family protein n=1 Tax=Amphibacillus sediminis TaxID=360185 RepID=UPI0009F95C01|nr:dihydrofolate reductase family protein [Amphibacillus sediminis]
MRKVIYSQMTSLDGFIEGPNGELEWSVPSDQLFSFINEREQLVDTHLYGRVTYQNMESYWPDREQASDASDFEIAFSRKWKEINKLVFSSTLTQVEWNSILVRDQIKETINQLKNKPGGDLLLGGAGLAKSFMELDLIDQYHLYIHPIILGSGKRLFSSMNEPKQLKLVNQRSFAGGIVWLCYQRGDQHG